MKSTIIFLGIVALTFTTAQATNIFKSQDLSQQEVSISSVDTAQFQTQLVFVNQEFSKNTVGNNSDNSSVFDPNTVVKTSYTKPIEEVIAENKQITESQEEIISPLSLEKTVQDYIYEDNQIIESTIGTEVYPLDFEKINHAVKNDKIANNNLAVTVDLKL